MTKTTKAQRQRRYRMAKDYLHRRAYPGRVNRDGGAVSHFNSPLPWSVAQWDAYNAWVDNFPKFMRIAYPGKLVKR